MKLINYISFISFPPRIIIYIIISCKYSKIYLITLIYYNKKFDRNRDNIPITNAIIGITRCGTMHSIGFVIFVGIWLYRREEE
jgi:hypothetical protein